MVDPKVGKVPNPMQRRTQGVGKLCGVEPSPLLYHAGVLRTDWIDTTAVFRCTTESGYAVHSMGGHASAVGGAWEKPVRDP